MFQMSDLKLNVATQQLAVILRPRKLGGVLVLCPLSLNDHGVKPAVMEAIHLKMQFCSIPDIMDT